MTSRVLGSEDHTPEGFKWLRLKQITWEDPHGRQRLWECAERSTRRGAIDGVAIVAKILRKGQPPVLPVLKQYRPPIESYCMELPAGLVDCNETAGEAAVRELKEETGYTGVVQEVTPICVSDPGMSSANMQYATLTVDGDAPENQDVKQQLDDGEFIQVELVRWDGLLQHIQDEMRRTGCAVDARLLSYAYGLEHAKEAAALVVAEAAARAAAARRSSSIGSSSSSSVAVRHQGAKVAGNSVGAAAASFKLSLVCCLVGWLLRSKQIPANAAPVLSKVSFCLLIPCMLFSRCSQILSSAPDPGILLTISAFVVLQVSIGAALGTAVAPVVDSLSRGWRFEDGAAEAAGAAGQPSGLRQLVTLACSFGSSFTLPVVFFSSMLPGPAAERALGYLALILLSWSPLLWSAGPLLLRAPSGSGGSSSGSSSSSAGSGSSSSESDKEEAAQRRSGLASSPAATMVRLRAFARKVATPPFLAVLAGTAAGMTPLGRVLVAPSSATAAEMLGPLGAGILRNVVDVIKMLAGGALAGQSVVLAASLLQDSGGGTQDAAQHPSGSSSSGGVGGFLAGAKRLLLPTSLVEARVLAIVGLTRFLLLPALTLAGVLGLQRWGLLPAAVAADPVLLLVLLAGSVMPTAQNLIVLLQLSARTQPLAPVLARMLLKLYAYSILPVSLWISGWATWLGVQVVC